MKLSRGAMRPALIIFILLNAFFIIEKNFLEKKGFDQEVLIIGHLIVFFTVLTSFFILQRSINSPNPQSFVRAMYGSFMIKLFVLVIAAFAYIMVAKARVNKPALFTCIGLYFVYTFIEVSSLTKVLKEKKKKNA